jgi:hypothetical protein
MAGDRINEMDLVPELSQPKSIRARTTAYIKNRSRRREESPADDLLSPDKLKL